MIQFGVVLFNLSQIEAYYFGMNGWLILFVVFAIVTLNILLIGIVYRLGNGRSIFEIFEEALPSIIRIPLYIFLTSLWGLLGSLLGKQYVLIFQMIAFPTSSTMLIKLLIDLLGFYLVSKGIYTISKASSIFFWLVIWTAILFLFLMKEFEFVRLTPFIFREHKDYLEGFFYVYPAFLGFEFSLLLFPYVNKKSKLIKSTFLGNLLLTIVYLIISIFSFGFFGYHLLKELQFPMIELFACIQLPFIERMENIIYGFFLCTTIITLVFYFWSAKEALSRVFPKVKQNTLGIMIIAITYLISFCAQVLNDVETWLRYLGYLEIGVAVGLPLILIMILLLQRKRGGIIDK